MILKVFKSKKGKPKTAKLKCDKCGVEFNRSFSRLNIHKNHFCSLACAYTHESRKWKGGRATDSWGYILIYSPEHPNANNHGYVREHRLVMEEFLGRYLTSKEVIHHINGIRADNRIENLELFKNNKEHFQRLHLMSSNKLSDLQICWTILKNQVVFN